MEKRNKYLIIVIIILVIAIGIAGFFAYQSYRATQTDKLMLQVSELSTKYTVKYNETNDITNTTPINYDKLYTNMDELVNTLNEGKSVEETAYQSADGPYKDLITLFLKNTDLNINSISLWKQRNQYIQQKNIFLANEIVKQEDDNTNELTKNNNEISTFLSTHPDIKEHVSKYWNITY